MDSETLCSLKIKNIHKKIYSNIDKEDITNEITNLILFIEKNYKDIELVKKIDQIINFFSIKLVIENREYLNSFYKNILIYYFNLLKLDKFSFLALVFTIILKNYGYPSDFEITKIILKLSKLYLEYSFEEDIYDFFSGIKEYLIENFKNSSSYTLFRNSIIRNKIVLYLYEYYKKNKRLALLFKFSGVGIEPLMFSYIIRILSEIESGFKKQQNIKIYCYDKNIKLLNNFLNTNFFDNIFLKLKESICKENNIKLKEIKTTLKDCKKDIIIIEKLELVKNIDFIFINNILTSENNELLLKELAIFDNGRVVVEKKENFEIDKKFLYDSKYNFLLELVSQFDERSNKIISFILLEKEIKKIEKKDNKYSLDFIFNNYKNLSLSELKDRIKKIEFEKNSINMLRYALLLEKSGYYSKSFDIIKKEYTFDYKLSYEILKNILNNTKNNKLKNSVEKFIKENHIMEKGFTLELIEAINDEIEEYLENKKTISDEDWL